MIKHVDKYNVSQIFSNERSISYVIPKYQREYTWGQKEWNSLFNDVIDNTSSSMGDYFLGSIICVDESRSAMGGVLLEVIDGQQRITSLSLLMLALYSKLRPYYDSLDDDQQTDINNLKREIVISRDRNKAARLTPQVQNHNQQDYYSLLCEHGLLQDKERQPNAGNRRIYRAFNALSKMIDDYLEENVQDGDNVSCLLDLVRRFNSVTIVVIEVETHRDAYMLFESLNNRGIPLSAIDLIKNLLISTADRNGEAEECYSKWKQIINYLGDDYSIQERFFRQFYNAYREELNAPYPSNGKTKYALGYLATKSTLLDIYEKLIKTDYKKFLNRIEREAYVYAVLTGRVSDDTLSPRTIERLSQLEKIQGAPAYLLLLYIFSNRERLALDNSIIEQCIEILVKFFVRRNVTDFPNTRNLTKLFMDLVSMVSGSKGAEVYSIILSNLRQNSASDQAFKEKLNGQVYLDNPDAARFILCHYEEQYDTKEKLSNLWARDKNKKYIWTIEHIFPEGEHIPDEWVEMIADGDRSLASSYLNTYTHKLGNLTMTGYNQNLSNMSFEKKKNRKDADGRNIGYRNGLRLNSDVVNKPVWKISDIQERTEKLVKYCLEEFSL